MQDPNHDEYLVNNQPSAQPLMCLWSVVCVDQVPEADCTETDDNVVNAVQVRPIRLDAIENVGREGDENADARHVQTLVNPIASYLEYDFRSWTYNCEKQHC